MSEQTSAAAPATAADIMRPPLTTVEQADHIAAAAYLMKRAGTTALMVLDAQTGQPIGIITEADIAILYFSTRLIRAGAWNAYLPVLLPGRLRIRPRARRASR